MSIKVEILNKEDFKWAWTIIKEEWVSLKILSHGTEFNVKKLPGLVAYMDGEKVGLLFYTFLNEVCEIITLNSLIENMGIGSALLHSLEITAKKNNINMISATTTNNNIKALRFYQKNGFTLNKLRKNILSDYRKVKPNIPLISENKIPIRDEIDLIKIIPCPNNAELD
ncbi:MAG: GNAT family N-acetyltransferase [Candidatus Lokiarchaeota archaeon]|nr:GNAT family N-acetyltransferase [Candidatus Lokiarchaeota archaeon]MBD3199671.1 GNAT family N-acetyltransferase [Candidatus Lokiarchaeota archaeon]